MKKYNINPENNNYNDTKKQQILDLIKREKAILEMIYKDGLNQNEISEKLGYTRQNISLIKIKGMKNLKKIIKKELNK